MEENSSTGTRGGFMAYVIVVGAILLLIVRWCVFGMLFPKAPEMSNEYLVGFKYGGHSWGSWEDCVSAYVIICTNHEVLVKMPTAETMYTNQPEYELVYTLTIPDKLYSRIEEALDREKLYTMKIDGNDAVCDGDSKYLDLYDPNNNLLKSCGAYMPTTKAFTDMYQVVIDNIPNQEILQIREEYIKEHSAKNAE